MKIITSVTEIFIFAANELRAQDFSPIRSGNLLGGPEESGAEERYRKTEVCFWPSQEAGEMQVCHRERQRLPAGMHDPQAAPGPLGRK